MECFSVYEYLESSNKYELAGKVEEKKVKKGEYIYLPPESPPFMYEIVSGAVKIGSYSDKGEEVMYDMLAPGEIFGNMQYLSRDRFQEFARARTALALRIYDLAFYKYLVVHDPTISEWFNRYIVGRWCRVEARFFSVSSNDIDGRVLLLFKQYEQEIELHDGSKRKLISLFSQKDIADLSAATRQSVSASIKRLRKKGYVASNRSKVHTYN